MLGQLQEKAELSIFTEEFLVSEAMAMSDRQYELYVEKKHARKEGLEEGRAEGRAEGRVEGRAEGRAEGRVEGRAEGLTEGANAKAREMAKKMLQKNKPIEEIVEFTELSEAEVLSIKASLI